MSKRCGCASDTCTCFIAAGSGIGVSGGGTRTNPYVIDAAASGGGGGGGGGYADAIDYTNTPTTADDLVDTGLYLVTASQLPLATDAGIYVAYTNDPGFLRTTYTELDDGTANIAQEWQVAGPAGFADTWVRGGPSGPHSQGQTWTGFSYWTPLTFESNLMDFNKPIYSGAYRINGDEAHGPGVAHTGVLNLAIATEGEPGAYKAQRWADNTTGEVWARSGSGTVWTSWVKAGGGMPTGGTVGQLLTKRSSTDGDASWKNSLYKFRGVWSQDTLVRTIDFGTSGPIPAPFTANYDGLVATGPPALDAVSNYSTPANLPPGVTGCIRVIDGTLNGAFQRLILPLDQLGIPNITRVKFWWAAQAEGAGGAGAYKATIFKVNGSQVFAFTANPNSPSPWGQYTFTSLNSSATLSWEQAGNQTVSFSTSNGTGIAHLEVYASGDPYLIDDCVYYNGALYRCTADNASAAPDTLTGWALLPITANPVKTLNGQTGTGYTLVAADSGKFVTMTNAGASTLTVPPNSGVAFPVGTVIEGAQLGAGQVTLTPGAGVTINGTPGLKVAAQYGTFGLIKTATDVWLAYGRLST